MTLFDRTPQSHGAATGGGHTVRGHWRRGHMRMQPHGPKNSLRKLIVIKPILIHPEDYRGDGSVLYVPKNGE